MTQSNIYYIDHSNTCELAHLLTEAYCQRNNLRINSRRECGYSKKVEQIFNMYLDMVEKIMLLQPIKTLKEFNQYK